MDCPDCGQRVGNDLELLQHQAMVHDAKWTGQASSSKAGDESSTGDITPRTHDYERTENRDRGTAASRAKSRQTGPGS